MEQQSKGYELTEDVAQPEASPGVETNDGQGADSGNGNDLYGSFLEGVPEEIHDQVIGALKAQDAEYTKRDQSRAAKTKPFEELGVFDQDPEAVGQYLQLDQAMQAAQQGDEQAIEAVYNWWDQVGEGLNFYDAGEEGEGGEFADEDDEFDVMDLDRKSFDAAVQRQVQEIVGPMAERMQSKDLQEAEAQQFQEANEQIDSWIYSIKEENPVVFGGEDGEKVLDEVLELAELFVDSDNPVQAGFEKYQTLVSKGEAGLFAQKANQPNVPEGAGRPDTNPPAPTMKNAKEVALEYVRNGNAMR